MKLTGLKTQNITSINRFGPFFLGMELKDFIPKYCDYDSFYRTKSLEIVAIYPDIVQYKFLNCIALLFNLKNGKLCRIDFENGFEGKIYGKIGIGSSLSEIQKHWDEIAYDDEYVLLKDESIILLMSDDLTPMDYNTSADQIFIEMITLEDNKYRE